MASGKPLLDRLIEHVLGLGVRPGGKLPPERELAIQLGVSRPALREAIGHLVLRGVLVARRGSGTYLAAIDVDDLLVVRLQLEPLAAELAARHASPAERDRLVELLEEVRGGVDDAARFRAADLAIHATIAQAAANPVLTRSLDDLDQIQRLSRSITAVDPAVREQAVRELERLVEAVRAGRPAEAREAMRAHLASVGAIAASLGGTTRA